MDQTSQDRQDRPSNLPAFRYTFDELLKAISQPAAPGAMGVSAMLGATGAALVTKVARLTLGQEGFEAVTEEMQRIASRASTLGEQLQGAIDQDAQHAIRLAQASMLPQATAEEQEIRRECIGIAVKNAIAVAMNMAQTGLEVARLAETVARYGDPSTAPEARLALFTLSAAVRGSLLTASNKFGSLSDTGWVEEQRLKAADFEREIAQLEREFA